MKPKQKPLTVELSNEWAEIAQMQFLDSLMSDPKLRGNQIVFHGGTSLHLSWRSPRYSLDCDFLVSHEAADLKDIVDRARKRTEEALVLRDPGFRVAFADKTKDADRMSVFDLTISHPNYMGNRMVRAEFWRVSPEYLQGYPSVLRTPAKPGDMMARVSSPIPVASLEAAFADKLTAFATRPFVKMRDVFDLWWIGTQTNASLPLDQVAKQLVHNSSAYETVNNLPLPDALRTYLAHDEDAILAKAETDLKRFLPPALWDRLHPEVTRQMHAFVRQTLTEVANHLENANQARRISDFRSTLDQPAPAAVPEQPKPSARKKP